MAEVKRAVAEFGMIEIPPFDHPSIIAGQGTIAFELNEQLNDIDYIFSGLSGGGLLGGIGLAMKHLAPQTHIVGVSLAQGAAMWESLKAGKPVMVEEVASVADSLGGGIGMDNRWTLPAVKQVMDQHFGERRLYRRRAAVAVRKRENFGRRGGGGGSCGAIAISSGHQRP